MSRMLAYVEDRIIKKVAVSLHFDDNTIVRTEIAEGDEIAVVYLQKKALVELQGRVRDIFVNRFNQTTLKMDISSRYRSGIIYIVTDNIRGFLEVKPGEPPHEGVIGDGVIDTFEEVVDQLTWKS